MNSALSPDRAPECFISYSWDSEEHKKWVLGLATDLMTAGVNTSLDQYSISLGNDFIHYMERSIRRADYVLLVCTPKFREKSEDRKSGVGYEGSIISSEIFEFSEPASLRKFVPLLRDGSSIEAIPSYLRSRLHLDFRTESHYNAKLNELLRHIYDRPAIPTPKKGVIPDFSEDIIKFAKRSAEKSPKPTRKSSIPRDRVFINIAPLDANVKILQATGFCLLFLGLSPLTGLESSPTFPRLDAIVRAIDSSEFSIHDISRTTTSGYSTFNIPFELGIVFGKSFAKSRRKRRFLLMASERTYPFASDIAGLDINYHNNDLNQVIMVVRDFFAASKYVPSSAAIINNFQEFNNELPVVLESLKISPKEILTIEYILDYFSIVDAWVRTRTQSNAR